MTTGRGKDEGANVMNIIEMWQETRDGCWR